MLAMPWDENLAVKDFASYLVQLQPTLKSHLQEA